MKIVLIIFHLFYVDYCVQSRKTLKRPVYNYSAVKLLGQDVVFRVVNGREASLGDVPYQVGLMRWKDGTRISALEAFCGGAIISPSRVVSAAHCVQYLSRMCYKGKLFRSDVKHIYAVAGNLAAIEYRSYRDGQGHGQWRRLSGGLFPEQYKFPNYDVALLHVGDPFIYNIYVSPVPYAETTMDYGEIECTISGFGRTSMVTYTKVLLFAEVNALPAYLCNAVHGTIMDDFVCTRDSVSDVHKGDSGGPLVCRNTGDPKENNTGLLVGVVSGKIFGLIHSSFFTRLSRYRQFLNKSSKLNYSYTNQLFLAVIVIKLTLTPF